MNQLRDDKRQLHQITDPYPKTSNPSTFQNLIN